MSGYRLRRASKSDAATITQHRRAMFAEMGAAGAERLEAMAAAFTPWVAERLVNGTYLAWLVEDSAGVVVAGAGLWLMDWPPHTVGSQPRRGNILNVYVAPEQRRRGLARKLMQAVLAWCRENAVDVVILHASDAGRPLYESLGFRASNEMRLALGG